MTTPKSPTDFLTSLTPASSNRPGDDPIFALHAQAKRRAAQGEDVLDATLGALMEDDGRLAILPTVAEAIRRIDPESAAAYAPIVGPPAFLAAVSRDLFGPGELAGAAVAAATPGGTGAVHAAIVNFLELGQEALTTSYFWGPYRILAEHAGRRLATFPMFGADGRFHLDAFRDALRAQISRQERALVLLNVPCHNPTGYSLDDAEWEGMVEIVAEAAALAPVALLLDMAYVKFGGVESAHWVDHVEKLRGSAAILCAWSGSKAFAQYGARIGALVVVPRDAEDGRRVQAALGYTCRGTWSNCNHLAMLAVTELLSDRHLRERCERDRGHLRRLLAERVQAFNELAPAAGLRYPRYEGGFFVAVFTDDPEGTVERMKKDGVFVVPLHGAVRVALCATPRASVPRLVDALASAIRAGG